MSATAWLLWGCVGGLLLATIAAWPRWQRWWFELEDPRSIAALRILLALLLIAEVNGLWPWFELLFAADGMFTGAGAREAFAASWGGGDVGLAGAIQGAIQGPFSALYFTDHPAAPWIVLGLFEVAATLLLVGLWTRPAAVATLLLTDTLFARNLVFWEGTEVVFRVLLVYLVCARSGAAYSVDAWRRRRSRARAGLPEEPDPPPIPAWPRRLMMVQMAVLFGTTGLLKQGRAWIEGDAVYYALTYEHFVRLRVESLLAGVGPAALAGLTWLARTIEALFPLALVGAVARWAARAPPLAARARRWRSAGLLVASACSTAIVALHGAPRLLPFAPAEPTAARLVAASTWVLTLAGAAFCASALATRSDRAGRLAALALSRRLWCGAAAALLLGMWLLMNIGLFHPVTLVGLLSYVGGRELAAALRRRRSPPAPPPPGAPPGDPPDDRPSHPASGPPLDTSVEPPLELAYTPRARAVLGVLIAWHLLAIGAAVLPGNEATAGLREPLAPVAGPWLTGTRTWQSWGMWGDAPRENVFMKAALVDADGRRHDLRTDLYAAERRPPDPLAYDRWWKIAERLVKSGDAAPYRPAYARWLCRQHSDARPVAVEIIEITAPIPTPAENRRLGGYDPDAALAHARERLVSTHPCAPAPLRVR
ncbi:MAG: hypothetical protein R3A79_08365 [Nannocystaceae bacterium]